MRVILYDDPLDPRLAWVWSNSVNRAADGISQSTNSWAAVVAVMEARWPAVTNFNAAYRPQSHMQGEVTFDGRFTAVAEYIGEILGRLCVVDYVKAEIWTEEIHRFRQDRKGRPDKDTRYRRETTRRLRVRWTVDKARIDYDEKSDGMYPLLTNDRSLSARQVLEAHKQQPTIEKRFKQTKTVHEIASVFLKNEGRIEALFHLYFIALLIQALIERELRRAMQREQIESLPLSCLPTSDHPADPRASRPAGTARHLQEGTACAGIPRETISPSGPDYKAARRTETSLRMIAGEEAGY